jgi:hypothetical protein
VVGGAELTVVLTSVVLSDTPTETVFQDTWTDNVQNKVIATAIRPVAKAGSVAFNEAQIRTKAQQALTTNATYLAIASPTTAQNTAQVKALAREVNGLIRLLLGALTDVSDT